MNRQPDVELVLRDYFADDGFTAPDHVLDVVEERIARQPRRSRSAPRCRRRDAPAVGRRRRRPASRGTNTP